MIVVDARQLTKSYGEGPAATHALRGVDLQVEQGSITMLSGPSGSGKTTLLSMLGCVLTPTTGELTLFGHSVAHSSEAALPQLRRSLIGFVFQGFNLIASLSCAENVELVLKQRGLRTRQARTEARDLLASVGLANKSDELPRNLSGGQRQRVAIARALAGRPPLVLADEPTASLDAHAGKAAMELLSTLAREHGTTVVVVTHDNRIFSFADRIVHIEDGRIQGEDRP